MYRHLPWKILTLVILSSKISLFRYRISELLNILQTNVVRKIIIFVSVYTFRLKSVLFSKCGMSCYFNYFTYKFNKLTINLYQATYMIKIICWNHLCLISNLSLLWSQYQIKCLVRPIWLFQYFHNIQTCWKIIITWQLK